MCYRFFMATATKQNASARMVVLLRPSEKLRLQRLARKERVSAAEIIRRSLAVYEELEGEENTKLLAEMSSALDKTHEAIQQSLAAIDGLRTSRV
jgi:hypothetical protein